MMVKLNQGKKPWFYSGCLFCLLTLVGLGCLWTQIIRCLCQRQVKFESVKALYVGQVPAGKQDEVNRRKRDYVFVV